MEKVKKTTFSKGQSGNPKGRPKGARNKVNTQIRDRIQDFVSQHFETLQNDILKLPRKERVKAMMDLLPYVAPKLSSTGINFDFDSLTDDQLNQLADHLTKRVK